MDIGTVERIIESKQYAFYMRSKRLDEYSHSNMTFSSPRTKSLYIMREMAVMCDTDELCSFLINMANKIEMFDTGKTKHIPITKKEFDLLSKFLVEAYPLFKEQAKYINLEEVLDSENSLQW